MLAIQSDAAEFHRLFTEGAGAFQMPVLFDSPGKVAHMAFQYVPRYYMASNIEPTEILVMEELMRLAPLLNEFAQLAILEIWQTFDIFAAFGCPWIPESPRTPNCSISLLVLGFEA